MLSDKEAIATVAVKDLQAAAAFYEGKLGLAVQGREGDQVIGYRTGATRLNVYVSRFAGTNQATAVTWPVGDELEAIVRELKAKGVAFERYDLPGLERDGDIHRGGGLRVAWFKDPDGNIFNLVSG
ncbi:MAG TPA: VOC family protein [Caldimonas sp.]|nr:VOC family protein [Caldimonas sp.]